MYVTKVIIWQFFISYPNINPQLISAHVLIWRSQFHIWLIIQFSKWWPLHRYGEKNE